MAKEQTIGERIKAGRTARGLSVADLAKAAKVDAVTIYRIEANGAKPHAATVARLIKALAKVPKLPEI